MTDPRSARLCSKLGSAQVGLKIGQLESVQLGTALSALESAHFGSARALFRARFSSAQLWLGARLVRGWLKVRIY